MFNKIAEQDYFNNLLLQSNAADVAQKLQTSIGISADISRMLEDEALFTIAENWLNAKGIKTRTEYGNLLPTYNLFLKIGEWLTDKENNDE